MQRMQLYLGEERYIRIKIHAANNEPFLIRDATWTLNCAGQKEAAGDCIIEDNRISAKIAPAKKTLYQLLIKYHVADEKLIEVIEVAVE